uniref:Secreted protein n=1 Tax=Romanomermis culicivorax TaxID=13658 RepID=A0A915HS73_ROMCU
MTKRKFLLRRLTVKLSSIAGPAAVTLPVALLMRIMHLEYRTTNSMIKVLLKINPTMDKDSNHFMSCKRDSKYTIT